MKTRTSAAPARVNIYLDDPHLRIAIKVAAARSGITVSAYCLQAIRRRLADDGLIPHQAGPGVKQAAASLDRLRRQVGPIGISVRELIAEGRQ